MYFVINHANKEGIKTESKNTIKFNIKALTLKKLTKTKQEIEHIIGQ